MNPLTTIQGDHSEVIQPVNTDDTRYKVWRDAIDEALQAKSQRSQTVSEDPRKYQVNDDGPVGDHSVVHIPASSTPPKEAGTKPVDRAPEPLVSLFGRPFPKIWHVPRRHNFFFTGRDHVLEQIASDFRLDNLARVVPPQALSGLPGIGKTQTAADNAIDLDGAIGLLRRSSLLQREVDRETDLPRLSIHRVIQQILQDEMDPATQRLWAERAVRAVAPVTLTSSFVGLANLLHLPERDEKEQQIAVDAVLRWLRLNHGWLLIFDSMDNLRVAESFLPKAGLGHILFTTRMHALSGIAQRLEVSKMEPETGALLLLCRASFLPLQATLDVASKDDSETASKISRELDGLPLALDQAGVYIKEVPCTLTAYLEQYQTRRKDLLQVRGSFGENYPLVQAVLQDGMDEPTKKQWAKRVVHALHAAFPSVKHQYWSQCDLLLPHAKLGADLINAYGIVFWDAARLLNQTGLYLSKRARYQEAEPLYQRALSIDKQVYGPDRPEVATTFNNLAELYRNQGKYAQAEPLYQRALAISEQQLEAKHPDTALSLNNLALLYFRQGKYAEAEPLYQRALHIWEQSLGPDHPQVATVLNNLAALYDGQEKYAEVESLYVRVLAIREAKYLDTVFSLNNLASLYKKQGKYAEAEPLYVRVLAIHKQQMGVKHLDTVLSLNNLALLYYAQGKYAEAGPLYIQALTICDQLLGPKYSTTKTIRQNYGLLILQTMKRKVWRKILRQCKIRDWLSDAQEKECHWSEHRAVAKCPFFLSSLS